MSDECFALPGFYSSLITHYSSLITHYSLLITHYSSLITHRRDEMNHTPRTPLPITEMQTLIFRVCVAGWIFDAQENQRHIECVGEIADERDRAAGALHHWLASVAARARVARS